MKKALKLLSLAAMITALLAGINLTAFASVASSHVTESGVAREADTAPGTTNAVSDTNDTSKLNNVANPISESRADTDETARLNNVTNPHTGMNNLSVPAIVALLAASTAAITLTAKKRS